MSGRFTEVSNRVRKYFRAQAKALAAGAESAICEHPGLIGSHRETLNRLYLRKIIPKRFEIDRGIVSGPFGSGRESDIVIWDSQNYPSLPLADHNFFFAESVRLILEVKSSWNNVEFRDVVEKCHANHGLDLTTLGSTIADDLQLLREFVYAMSQGLEHHGTLKVPAAIGKAAMFFKGGKSFKSIPKAIEEAFDVHQDWPDLCLLLDVGRVVVKKEIVERGNVFAAGKGIIEFADYGDDALLVFTSHLLSLLTARSVQVETPFDLKRYAFGLEPKRVVEVPFRITGPVVSRQPFWS